jgi:hypothetical protein
VVAGNDSVRATTTRQAGALGDTSMGAMTASYDRLLARNPAQYTEPYKTLATRPSEVVALFLQLRGKRFRRKRAGEFVWNWGHGHAKPQHHAGLIRLRLECR